MGRRLRLDPLQRKARFAVSAEGPVFFRFHLAVILGLSFAAAYAALEILAEPARVRAPRN